MNPDEMAQWAILEPLLLEIATFDDPADRALVNEATLLSVSPRVPLPYSSKIEFLKARTNWATHRLAVLRKG